jgi:short-subunit dehydrogenase
MAHLLITGAASGLGAAIARDASQRGHAVSLVDVQPGVQALAETLGGRALVVDLSDADAAAKIHAWAPEIDALINNAGVATRAMFADMPADKARQTLMVNAFAPMQLSGAYLAGFRARGSGVILNVSSSASYFPTPGLAPYGATKAFLTAFTEALMTECEDAPGVRIIGFCPSGMATNFQKAAGVKNEDSGVLMDPAKVARRVVDLALTGRSGTYDHGPSTHAIKLLRRVLPGGLYRTLMGRMLLRQR